MINVKDNDLNILKQEVCGVGIHAVSMEVAIKTITDWISKKEQKLVVTPNLDHLALLSQDPLFKAAYALADLVLSDGWPVLWLAKWSGKNISQLVCGSDITPLLLDSCIQDDKKIFILGSRAGASQRVKEKYLNKFTKAQIEYNVPPLGFEKDEVLCQMIVDQINHFEPDLLFICLGAPKQEKWFLNYHQQLYPCVSLCIGASIDFIAGMQSRAPRWIRIVNMEWAYRFIQEPFRLFQRYFVRDIPYLIKMFFKLKKQKRNDEHSK